MGTRLKSDNVFEQKIHELFSKQEDKETNFIWKTVSLILYNSENRPDLLELYRMVDEETFIKIMNLFGGRSITFPSVRKLQDTLLLALIYYYREIQKMSWSDIQKEFPFDISHISYGIKIKNLNNFVKQKLDEIYRKTFIGSEGKNDK